MSVLNKAIVIVAVIVIMAVVVLFGVRQYGNARVAAQELGTVKEAVSGAVEARDQAVVRDIQQGATRAVAVDSVRAVVRSSKEKSKDVPKPCADPVGDSERLRLLNLAIDNANRVIESAN